jgi:hypothetical protein
MDLSINKQYAFRPTAKQWEAIRPEIERLYVQSDPPLPFSEIRQRLLAEHGFDVQLNQFKYRIRAWKLMRNYKHSGKRGAMETIRSQMARDYRVTAQARSSSSRRTGLCSPTR